MRRHAHRRGLALLSALALGSGALLPLAGVGAARAASRTGARPAATAGGLVRATGGPDAGASEAAPAGATTPARTGTIRLPARDRTRPGAAGGTAAPAATTPTTTYQPLRTTPLPAGAKVSPAQGSARAAGHHGDKVSTGAIVAASIAALLALGCAAWGIARMHAYEPHWTLSARHALAEAGFRASSTWDEFRDWIRLGR